MVLERKNARLCCMGGKLRRRGKRIIFGTCGLLPLVLTTIQL
jgi:hypothetical protein